MYWQGDSHIATSELVYGTDFKDNEAAVGCGPFEAFGLFTHGMVRSMPSAIASMHCTKSF